MDLQTGRDMRRLVDEFKSKQIRNFNRDQFDIDILSLEAAMRDVKFRPEKIMAVEALIGRAIEELHAKFECRLFQENMFMQKIEQTSLRRSNERRHVLLRVKREIRGY